MDLNEHDKDNAERKENVADHDKNLTDGQASVGVCNQTSTDLYENVDSTSVNSNQIEPAVFCGETQHDVATINGTERDKNSKVGDDKIPEKELGVLNEVPISDDKSDTTCSHESEEDSDQCEDDSFVFERNVTVKITHNNESVEDNGEQTVAIDVDTINEEITDSESHDIITQNRHLNLVDYEITNSDISGEQNISQSKVSTTDPSNLSLKPHLNCEEITEALLDTENIKEEPTDDYEQQTVTETNSETVADTDKTSKILSMYQASRTEDTVDTLNDDRK